MKVSHSFRSRLLFGSVLGALGLLLVAHIFSVVFIHRFPITLRFQNASFYLAIALVLILIGISQVRKGLSPFDLLRKRLTDVRDGREHLLEGIYPTEVQPLVTDLNALLEHREQVVRRALAKAGDLAHGLKTPLAVLAQEGERAEAAGHHEIAAAIGDQVERMRRQIDYHLAHARAAASGATPGTHCSVLDSAQGLARTLLRLHADRGLTIDVRVSPQHAVNAEREDLDEMLGNLLDNACKWARSAVTIESTQHEGVIQITVDDDGPGLNPSMRDLVLRRGVRADEKGPGSGLGLAIVSDLATLYGGSISLGSASSGGLQAQLRLPASGPA